MTVLIRKIRLKENVNNNKKYLFDHFRETVKILTKRYEQAPKNFYINDKGYNAAILYFFLMLHNVNLNHKISLLDLCINLNIMIPHYCYHSNLSIVGNCRMCLVEISTAQKPIASCAVDLAQYSQAKTDTWLVKKAREGIMEFLLINHPLDCPICDQGGECDLQDQSLVYGSDRGRLYNDADFKRSVTEFMFNPKVTVNLTRCIHCTRCVRFLSEIEGETNLGMVGRGNGSEIGLYQDSFSASELGSNITDFCPVGALTIKAPALKYRAWDEIYFETIDLNDSLCSSIRIYSDLFQIIRILPQYNVELGITWITEKTRHLVDGLILYSVTYPHEMLKISKPNKLVKVKPFMRSWLRLTNLLIAAQTKLFKNNFILKSFVGNFLELFTLLKLKEFNMSMGQNNVYSFTENLLFSSSSLLEKDFDSNYVLTTFNINSFKNFVFINLNLRIENPVLNAKIRHKKLWTLHTRIYYIGPKYNLGYKYIHLGTTIKLLVKIIEGRHYLLNFFSKDVETNKTLLLYGNELLKMHKNTSYKMFFNYLKQLNKFISVKYLATEVSSLNTFDLSIDRFITKKPSFENPKEKSKGIINYYIGSNQPLVSKKFQFEESRIQHQMSIYQNNHIDKYYLFMDYFFPTKSYYNSEKLFYINCFGLLKMNKLIFFPHFAVRDHIDQICLFSKIFTKNNKLMLKKSSIKSIYSYIPLELYNRPRASFYSLELKRLCCSIILLTLCSTRQKNFYKTSIYGVHSKNMNLFSHYFFKPKSNYKL